MKSVLKLTATVPLALLAMVVLALLISTASAQEAPQIPPPPPFDGIGDHITRVNVMFSKYDVAPPYGVVREEEVSLLQSYFGMTQDGANYIAWFDFNGDGVIDINDIAQVASRVDCTFIDACYW